MTLPFKGKRKPRFMREGVEAGKPESLSWDEVPWEYDDHAVECVIPGHEMTLQEIGEIIGINRERVRQLGSSVEKKLSQLKSSGFNADDALEESKFAILEIFKRYDRERLVERKNFAERLLNDEELQDRIIARYGEDLENGKEVAMQKFISIARALDREKIQTLRLVKN